MAKVKLSTAGQTPRVTLLSWRYGHHSCLIDNLSELCPGMRKALMMSWISVQFPTALIVIDHRESAQTFRVPYICSTSARVPAGIVLSVFARSLITAGSWHPVSVNRGPGVRPLILKRNPVEDAHFSDELRSQDWSGAYSNALPWPMPENADAARLQLNSTVASALQRMCGDQSSQTITNRHLIHSVAITKNEGFT